MKEFDANELLSVRQVAGELGITVSYIRRMIRQGELRAEKLGGTYYVIRRGDLEDYKRRRES